MGNRNGSSRRRQRDNGYVYTENRRNEYPSDSNSGSINRRSAQPQPQTYQQNTNGHGINPINRQTSNYPIANTSKKKFFSSSNELCFL